LWALVLLAATAATGIVTEGPSHPASWVRTAIVLAFLLTCPGWAIVRLLRLENALGEWTLATALSVTLDTLIAGGMLYAGEWSPMHSLDLLMGITAACAVTQLALPERSQPRRQPA
jgi:hypothetical protein